MTERGFTLLETLVALTLFAIVSAAIGGLLTQQVRTAASERRSSVGYSLGQQMMEIMRAQDFDAVGPVAKSTTVDGTKYFVQAEVLSGIPAPSLKTITVTTRWLEPGGWQDARLDTIFTKVTR